MLKNEAVISLSKVLTLPDGNGINKAYIGILLEEEIPVLCVNQSRHTQKLMPFKPLYEKDNYFWQKEDICEYFLSVYSLHKLEDKAGSLKIPEKENIAISDTENYNQQEEEAFGSEYNSFAKMSAEEKVERLKKVNISLNELLIKKSKDQIAIAEALANTTKDTAMINYAVLKEILNFADDQAKAYSRDVVIYTSEIVKSSARLLSENVFSDNLMKTIAQKSKGIVLHT